VVPRFLFSLLIGLALLLGAPSPLRAVEGGDEKAKAGDKDKEDALSKLPGWLGGKEVQFFRLPVFNLPVIREGRVAQQVSVNVTIETSDIRARNKIIENRIKIQNAFLRDLHGVVSLSNGTDRALLVPTVKARLQRVADAILGPGVVKQILVENVYVRNFN
jgi:hypothetical protein